MARNSSPQPSSEPEIKEFDSRQEIDHAIAKLERRVMEAEALQRERVRHDDQRRVNVASNIRQTILEIFGPKSPEYREHMNFSFYRPFQLNAEDHLHQQWFVKGVSDGISMLKGLIVRLEERRDDFAHADPAARVRSAFEGIDLHPRIAEPSRKLYRGGHYRNAVLDGYLALEDFIKQKSRCRDRDGVKLMEYVFSKDQPVLAFNGLADEADRDEQRGFMHMFQGAALALRNPRAHSLLIDTPEQGLEYLTMLSLLANLLERSQNVREP